MTPTFSRLLLAALVALGAALPLDAFAQGGRAPIVYASAEPGRGLISGLRPTLSDDAPTQSAPAPMVRDASWQRQERVGRPYEVAGRTYTPAVQPGYSQTGVASWYGPNFHGHATATGETYDQEGLSAAHPTLPLNSLVQITNLENGREAIVRINDRGPFVGDRLIDVSRRTADVLGFQTNGTTRVHVRYLGPAPQPYREGEGSPAPEYVPAVATAPVEATPAFADVDGPVSLTPPRQDDPAPQPARQAAAGAFAVQIGAFVDPAAAERVRAALTQTGTVSVEARDVAQGRLYRVRLTGFSSRADADTARRAAAGLGFPEAIVAAN